MNEYNIQNVIILAFSFTFLEQRNIKITVCKKSFSSSESSSSDKNVLLFSDSSTKEFSRVDPTSVLQSFVEPLRTRFKSSTVEPSM